MCICGSVGEGVFIKNETVHPWNLGERGSGQCALCRGCYLTVFVMWGVGKGQWLAGVVGLAHLGFV